MWGKGKSMVKILPGTAIEKKDLSGLIRKIPTLPYRGYPGVEPKNVIRLLTNEISLAAGNPQSTVLAAMDGRDLAGVLTFASLPWDTSLFGRKMGAIKQILVQPGHANKEQITNSLVTEAVQRAKDQKFEFVLGKVSTDDITSLHALEKNNFRLMDTLLNYVYDPVKHPFTELTQPVLLGGATIRLATLEDEEQLRQVSGLAFKHYFGRYHSDENIPRQKANQVYEEWISSSLHGYADFIVIAEIEGRIAAFTIWRNPTREESDSNLAVGHMSLVGVHPDYFGMGFFYTVMYEGMRRLITRVKCMESATHINNYPAQRGFAKVGWRIYGAQHAFHLWL